MALQNVISFEQSAGPAKRRIAAAKVNKLVADCRGQVNTTMPKLLTDLFEKLDDSLYQRADKSESDKRQQTYFEAMRGLRKVRQHVEKDFIGKITQGYDQFWGEGAPSESQADKGSLDELSLVDDDELEENLAVAGIVSKGENRFHRELYALNARFAHLAELDELANSENPVGPGALTEAFRASLSHWDGSLEVRLMVYKLFDHHVMTYVGALYDELNDALIAGDVLPRLTQRTGRNPVSPSIRRDSEKTAPETPGAKDNDDFADGAPHGNEGDVAGMDGDQLMSALSQLMAGRRGMAGGGVVGGGGMPGGFFSGGQPGPAGNGGIADSQFTAPGGVVPMTAEAYRRLPVVATRDVMGALDSLQATNLEAVPQTLEEAQAAGVTVRQNLEQELGLVQGRDRVRRLNGPEENLIDVISMLFEFILEDRALPDAMKALLSRLQIPYLKIALADKEFIAQKSHPARRLLNNLAKAASGWSDDGNRTERSLYGRIESIVNRILAEFTDDIKLLAELDTEFTGFLDKEERGAKASEARINQVNKGQEQLTVARAKVHNAISRVVREHNGKVPKVVRRLLRDAWKDVMLLAYLREGEESQAWKHSVEIAEKLVWSVLPKQAESDRQVLLRAIPELLRELRDGLAQISYDQHRVAQLFKELQSCHIASLRSAAARQQAEHADAEVVEDSVQSEVSTELVDEQEFEDETEEIVLGAVSPDEEDEFLSKVRDLVVGTWLEWQVEDESKVRAKLSWKSEVTGTYIFVDRRGGKVAEMTVPGLATLFRAGRVEVISEVSVPLMDRALSAMLEALHKPQQPGGPAPEPA